MTAPGGGRRLVVETTSEDDIGRRIAARGVPYEWEELAISDPIATMGGRVVDIGANVGNHALFWAAHSAAQVVAFEPQGAALDLLRRNVARNGLTSAITIEGVALGERPGRATLHVTSGNLGASRLVEDRGGDVEIATLDSFALRDVGLVKIDVEGMEASVIRGARETLDREHPAVWVEILSVEARAQVRSELGALGYSMRPLMMGDTNALFLGDRRQALRLLGSLRATRLLARRQAGRLVRKLRSRPPW